MANVSPHVCRRDNAIHLRRPAARSSPRRLLVFHVNSTDDRPLRERRRPILRELEPNYVLEEAGQTVRFFSRDYLRELLAEWEIVQLDHVEISDEATGEPSKRVWRVAARRPARRPSRRDLG